MRKAAILVDFTRVIRLESRHADWTFALTVAALFTGAAFYVDCPAAGAAKLGRPGPAHRVEALLQARLRHAGTARAHRSSSSAPSPGGRPAAPISNT